MDSSSSPAPAPVGSLPWLLSYDYILVAFSGGKDSIACVLHLLRLGVPKGKIELHHHDVDGREGSFMDWACTRDYCRKFAAALGLQIYFSWKVGGFEGEMSRHDAPTAPTAFETPSGEVRYSGGKGPKGTRGLFPQVSADLSSRWCSAYLKIDVLASAIRGQERFHGKRTLVITGERAQESAGRAKYQTFEPHRADRRDGSKGRLVDQWRPVHGWTEEQVWNILREFRINPHPAYRLGWGRVSCSGCIFGNADQFASHRAVNPEQFAALVRAEAASGKTVKRKVSLAVLADQGRPYPAMTPADIAAARSTEFVEPILLEVWTLPRGAYGDSCGPV